MPALATGIRIAGYRIEELAGRGGMGVVYRATQLSLGRTVALKLIAPELASDERFRERFKRESHLAASVDHPNVLPVYEAGETNGSLFLAMRWVEGTDLCTLIKRGGGLEPGRACSLVAQIGAALDAAHQLGLVHRDVKPANVLIADGADEHAYLTDFGLVKLIAGTADLTRSGEFVGSIDYIAPEQISGDGNDLCADVYALGCVLFHSLTGRVPFDTESEIAKIYAHLNSPPPRPSDVAAGVPVQLDGVVARAMAKDPGERYPSAGELGRAALAAVDGGDPARHQGETPTRPDAVAIPAERARGAGTHRWRVPGIAIAIALAAVVLVVLAIALTGTGSDDPEQTRAVAAPGDGSVVQARGSPSTYVLKAGAKFRVPDEQRAAFGYEPGSVTEVSRTTLRRIPNVPRDGALVRPYRSTLVWRIRSGQRHLTRPPAGADIAVIPSIGLRQIPPAPAHRRTFVTLEAPTFVQEARRFALVARVRSRAGPPRGACVFYRVGFARLMERANVPVRDGVCMARLKVSGVPRVRYSVHFVGYPGWRGSASAAAPMEVQPR